MRLTMNSKIAIVRLCLVHVLLTGPPQRPSSGFVGGASASPITLQTRRVASTSLTTPQLDSWGIVRMSGACGNRATGT